MTTSVVSRTVRSVPFRSARDTWERIVDILTAAGGSEHRAGLLSITGIAAAMITEKSTEHAPIVVFGGGPRVRIYCRFDDAALEGDSQNETGLSFNPLEGDWSISLPCPADDLEWVREALSRKTPRVSARDAAEGIVVALGKAAAASFEVNIGEFMKP